MRKLASIQKIEKLEPIFFTNKESCLEEVAENIVKATVLGWEVVVKKGEFKEGDICVYVEVDSILPEAEWSEFMRPRNFRVKTARMLGQISQGICFPLSILPIKLPPGKSASMCVNLRSGYNIGDDVTDTLGIKKWEPYEEEKSNKSAKKDKRIALPYWLPSFIRNCLCKYFPTKFKRAKRFEIWNYIPKTDETRVQVLGGLLQRHQGATCYITEKLDGSSVTFYLKDDIFGVCSRNIDLERDENNQFWAAAIKLDIENKMRTLGKKAGFINFALQGELVGPNIQGNKLQLKETDVYFFNIFDIEDQCYVDGCMLEWYVVTTMGLKTVPIITTNFKLHCDIPQMVSMATVKSTINPNVWAEGYVIRPNSCGLNRHSRVSFKVINPEFLLKFGE